MKSPLQKWAWERFRFKGSVIGTWANFNRFPEQYLSTKERLLLKRILRELNNIIDRWDESQRETRRRHEA